MVLLFVPILIIFLTIGISLRRRRVWKQQQAHIRQLRAWSAQNQTMDPVAHQWIQQLSDAESEVLLDLLSGYCTSLNWELTWLFTPQIEKAPVLKSALEESINAYARAILLSLQMEDDVHAYQTYLAFEKNPKDRKQRAVMQQLYLKISDTNLTQPPKRLFRRFSRKVTSHKQQVAAIQRAFERDPAFTMATLQEILATEETGSTPDANQELSSSSITIPSPFVRTFLSG